MVHYTGEVALLQVCLVPNDTLSSDHLSDYKPACNLHGYQSVLGRLSHWNVQEFPSQGRIPQLCKACLHLRPLRGTRGAELSPGMTPERLQVRLSSERNA